MTEAPEMWFSTEDNALGGCVVTEAVGWVAQALAPGSGGGLTEEGIQTLAVGEEGGELQ